MLNINMKSSANLIKGQGVGSCYDEQVALIKSSNDFKVSENGYGKFDIVHYHTVNLEYYFDSLVNKAVKVGYVHFLPNTIDDSLKLPWLFRKVFYNYLIKFYNNMDYLVTVNPYFVNEIRKYNINKPEVVCIPNFVNSDTFYPMNDADINKAREKYEIEKDKFVVLGVGQLQTRKGIVDFVETAKSLPNVQFIWAGGFSFGKISDGYNDIKKIVKNPPDNVKFMGIVDRSEMPEIYNIADVFFLPSYDELFPMSILEALCCKKPVLIRDVPLYDNILFDYCPRGSSVEQFAELISQMEIVRSEYSKWSERAWQCHNLYTKESALEQWTFLYNKVHSMTSREEEGVEGFKAKKYIQSNNSSRFGNNNSSLHLGMELWPIQIRRHDK